MNRCYLSIIPLKARNMCLVDNGCEEENLSKNEKRYQWPKLPEICSQKLIAQEAAKWALDADQNEPNTYEISKT
jgi:hypothetical protein